MANDEKWETTSRNAGKISGDLCFPLVFAPELHFEQFKSEVADMTNSVTVGPLKLQFIFLVNGFSIIAFCHRNQIMHRRRVPAYLYMHISAKTLKVLGSILT
jgi:hypothetical protein